MLNNMKNKFDQILFCFLKDLSKSYYLRYFLEESYSVELLLFLYEQKNFSGIENLYSIISFPKKRYPTFRTYIYYLNDKNCLKIAENSSIRREKIVSLNSKVILELDAILVNYK